jgi:TRAP-type C4-dicarboxylate transport system substrate-binding protein
VLNWGDAGWVHFFTRKPATRPDQIRKMKLFISAGDAEALDLYKAAGMRQVPLELTDILTALQTGMIDAFDVPPLLALLNQWFGLAQNMLDINWAPLIGATLITEKTWEQIPPSMRDDLLDAARQSGEKFRGDIRRLSDEAVEAMQKRGLSVHQADEATLELWRTEAEAIYPKLRGEIIPTDLFDAVRRLRDEYRARPIEDSR